MDSGPAARTVLNHGIEAGYRKGCRCEPCQQGHRDYQYRQYHAKPRLPFDPIVAFMSPEVRVARSKLIKAQTGKTISIFQADRLCCSLGFHPWQVYGDLYFQDLWEKNEQAKTKRH